MLSEPLWLRELNAPTSLADKIEQVVRLVRIPAQVRGRTFVFMRTLMYATQPAGSAFAGAMLAGGGYEATVVGRKRTPV